MKRIKKSLFIIVLIVVLIFPNYIGAKEKKDIKESKWRRFEIIFSISLPFTLIISYLLVSSIDAAFSKGKMFSIRRECYPYVWTTAVTLSGLIALKDIKKNSNLQETEK